VQDISSVFRLVRVEYVDILTILIDTPEVVPVVRSLRECLRHNIGSETRMFQSIFDDFKTTDPKSALTFLLILSAVGYPLLTGAHFAATIFCAIVALGSAIVFCRQGATYEVSASSRPDLSLVFLTAVCLGILTWLAFYRPMLEHFWAGYDEPVLLSMNSPWYDYYDKCCARPLAGLEAYFGNLVMPGDIGSLPFVNAVERWLLAVGLFLFMISLIPEAKLFAVATGLLMVVNPAELLRFTPGLGLPYGGVMLFFILASFLFISSYNSASRLLLLLGCSLLGIAFLHYESIFLVSTIIPVLLWWLPARPQRSLWAAAWYSTTFLLLLRFAIFFFSGQTYQSNFARRFTIRTLFENFPLLIKPIFRFITPIYDRNIFTPLPATLGVATFLFLAFIIGNPNSQPEGFASQRKQMKFVWSFSLAAITLAILPLIGVASFLRTIPNLDGDLTSRLEFTPGPFQAIAWAALIGWASSFLPRSRYWFAAGISVLISCSVLNSLELQANKGTLNTYLDFQKESDIFRAAAPMIEHSPVGSTIFFVINDDKPSPFGFGYHPFHMTCLLFGRESYAGHYSPRFGFRQRNTAFPSPIDQADNYTPLTGFTNMIVLSVDNDQNVTELKLTPEMEFWNSASSKPTGGSGSCAVPVASARPNGDLPFLLPSIKKP
jgi:hypothetical protein